MGAFDAALLIALIAALLSARRDSLPRGYAIAAWLFVLWCIASLIWAKDVTTAIGPLVQYGELFLVAPYVFSRASGARAVERAMLAYIWATTALAAAVIFYAMSTGSFSYVFFLNYQKNALGAIAGNALPILLGLAASGVLRGWRVWIPFALNLLALFMSSSRGSAIGAAVGILVFAGASRRGGRGLAALAASAAAFVAYLGIASPTTLTSLTDFGPNSSAQSRVTIFQDALAFIRQSPVIGSGVGSYFISLPSIGFQQRDPSNLILLTLAETGVIGLILLVVCLGLVFSAARSTLRVSPVGSSPRHATAALLGAFCSQLAHMQMDVSWVRGTSSFMFACVGLIFAMGFSGGDRAEGSVPITRSSPVEHGETYGRHRVARGDRALPARNHASALPHRGHAQLQRKTELQ